ncbi:MAG: methionyl-tRNA formyltransferase, partial [Bacteroidota bacterium]
MKIIFLGTPDFAVESLKAIVDAGLNVVAVVTAPDKPAGRGMHLQQSPVKKFAIEKNIPVLQPVKLKDENFIAELKSYEADLQVVIAFRMLPLAVWNMPKLGTINLHASLLPDYRGAAPINRAIMNGEMETGVCTFFLKHEIDTGDLVMQKKVPIGKYMNAGELHDILMNT